MKNDRVITFIHYGSKSFDVNMFNPVSNGFKPQGGLWACPYLETDDTTEYDAVYVDLWSIQNNWIIFPMWDVPSLLVFNPDVVKEVD